MKTDPAKPFPVRSITKKEVIITEAVYGEGIPDDPVRTIIQIWLEGKEIYRRDNWEERDTRNPTEPQQRGQGRPPGDANPK